MIYSSVSMRYGLMRAIMGAMTKPRAMPPMIMREVNHTTGAGGKDIEASTVRSQLCRK